MKLPHYQLRTRSCSALHTVGRGAVAAFLSAASGRRRGGRRPYSQGTGSAGRARRRASSRTGPSGSPVAREPDVAVEAIPGQRVAFGLAELLCRGRKDDQVQQGSLADVARQVTGFDVTITAVQVTVVLEGELGSARLGRPISRALSSPQTAHASVSRAVCCRPDPPRIGRAHSPLPTGRAAELVRNRIARAG
jgi:hypothetical protein